LQAYLTYISFRPEMKPKIISGKCNIIGIIDIIDLGSSYNVTLIRILFDQVFR
ncbi:hypothetical protein LCGC14_0908170, partial [marine sediment metagenome]